MALLYVTLTINEPAAAGAIATFQPSAWLTDTGDDFIAPPAPVVASLDVTGQATVAGLLANDSTGPLPAGWSWSVTFTGIPGVQPYGWSFQVLHANGATQALAGITPIDPAAIWLPFLYPSGAGAGKVWTSDGSGNGSWQAGGGGGGAVSSVFGRTGAVAATSGDYTVSEVTGAAPLASPALAGTPTAPTASALDDSTKLATTAYADTAVGVETARAEAAEAALMPLSDLPLSPANGGTGQTTQQAALDALAGVQTAGYVLGSDGTNVTMVPDAGVTWKVPAPTGMTAADTPNVEAAVTKLTTAAGGGTLLFQDGTYQVDGNALVIRSCSNFAVKGTGATVIQQAPNTVSKPKNTTGNLFTIADCTDFRVEGITLDGLRDTVAPLTPLTASASSGQPSVTVGAGNGARYVVGQGLALFGGLGSGEQAQSDGWAGGGGTTPLIISSITAGGGSGGGDLITFTANLGHSYAQISSTVSSDGFGPYAYAGAYLTPYQTGHNNSVAGRTLGGEDQQNGLHLISCQRFAVDRVTARNVWESPVKCGTGFASTVLTDGCSQGTISNCTGYHGYDQGVSLWLSPGITVTGCVLNACGWAGISPTLSDRCAIIGNQVLNSVYRTPGGLAQGYGIVSQGSRSCQVKGNVVTGTYADGIRSQGSPLFFGVTAGTSPTTSTFLEESTAAGTSVQVSATSALQAGGLYSILDGAQSEVVSVATIADGTHVTFGQALAYSHASGVYLIPRLSQGNVYEGNTVTGSQTAGGMLSHSPRETWKDNSVSDCPGAGLDMSYTTSGLPSGTAIAGDGGNVAGNRFAGISGTVIKAAGAVSFLISGNIVAGSATAFTQGIDVSGAADFTVTGNYVADCAGARGIYGNTGGLGSTACARGTVSANVVRSCASEGILFFGADSLAISGNTVFSCGGDGGINLRGCTRCAVDGNAANSNGTAGITLEDNSTSYCLYNRVTGNTARDDGTGTAVATGAALTQHHGIHETGNSNFNLYTGNECDGNSADQLVIIGASSYAWANIISGAVAGDLPVALGGTGQTTQQAALDALAGATTSGDFLRGNGTHVTMSAIQAADLPAGTTSAPGVLQLDGTATDIKPAGTQAAGAVGKPADAGHVHPYQPWQFYVGAYGAKGDGRIVGDGAMSSSVNPTFLTSATANFTSADVGKNIVVNGALGASNAPLYTTVASVTNSTTAVLNASATNTVSSAAVFLASDDSAAIVAAVTAASTWAQANTWKAQVIFDNKFYGLATLTTTAASGSLAQQNALVPIPYPNVNGTTQKLNIEFAGAGESADEQYFDSTIPSVTGTALVATVAASGSNPSIVGGPNAATNLTGTWANTKFTARGITVWAGFNPGWIGWDLRQCSACWVDNAGAQVFAPNGGGQNPGLGTLPANSAGCGIIFPSNNDNGAGRLMVEGFYYGAQVAPRTTIEKLFTNSNAIGVLAKTVNGSVTHGARIGYWSLQACTTAIASIGTSGTMPLLIDLYDSAGTITTDLSDAHGTLVGSMNWWHTVSTGPTVAAGFAMRIVNLRQNPGPMSSPPSPPSSGNPSTAIFRDTEVTLSLSGGTMTALLIDAVDQHIPSGCVLWKITVPSGHTYTPTYTGSLSTDVAVM